MSREEKYNFRIRHTINHKLFDKKYEGSASYEIELEKVENYNFRVKLTRYNFKIDDQIPDKKFEKIAHAYNHAIFPILFEIKEGNFLLANFNEISERITQKDLELKSRHQGPGLEHIRNDFLSQTTKDGYAMAEYIGSFGLIKILLLCIEKPENENNYHFNWKIPLLDNDVFWKGKKRFDSETNTLKYEGEGHQNEALFQHIKTAGNVYQYPDTVTDQESVITTTIKHETQYNSAQLDFELSETNIQISNTYFHYEENFSITAFSKTKDKYEY
jgi:hypothetical protein